MSDIPEPVLKRAYEWYAEVVGGDLDAVEQKYLASWLNADPLHLAAYERAQILCMLTPSNCKDRGLRFR